MYNSMERNCIHLSKSIVFKLNILPTNMNKTLEEKGYVISSYEKEWKYYLNLSGEKHISNSDVKITALEDGNVYSLTKEFLDEFKYSREVLTEYGKYYDELIDKYPLDTEYINGCIIPVDIDVAISSPEGTILAYHSRYVEKQEVNLISDLEAYIKKVLYRWKIDKNSNFENLYAHTIAAITTINLPPVILNLRLKNINTPYVHSYFMDIYFKSNAIGDEVYYLNKKSRFWLYRNLDYIKHNIGKNSTLHKLIDNIFTPNGIGISKADLVKLIGLDRNGNPYKEIVLQPKPYNPYYNENDKITIDDVLIKEILDNKSVIDELDDVDKIKDRNKDGLGDMGSNDENSKVVYIQMKNNYSFFPSKVDPIICHWAYMLKYNILNVQKNFTDPNLSISSVNGLRVGSIREYVDPVTSVAYKLNGYTAFLVLLKLLLNLNGTQDVLIDKVKFNGVLNKNFNVNDLDIYEDGYSREIIKNIHNQIPEMPVSINRDEDFKAYMDKYFDFRTDLWIKMSNLQNPTISGNIKLYGNFVEVEEYLNISSEKRTIDDILKDFDIDYVLGNGYDLVLSIKSLIKAFTTFVDDKDYYQEEAEKYKILLNKLTSYTIQPINQTSSDSSFNLYDNEPTILVTENPLATILDVHIDPLEDVELILDSYIDDYLNIVWGYINRTMVKVYGMRNITGGGGLYFDKPMYRNVPVNIVTVTNAEDYDILDEEWKDEFISGVKIKVDTLEDGIEIDTVLEEHIVTTNLMLTPNTVTSDMMEPIKGNAYQLENKGVVLRPTNIVTLLDDSTYDIKYEDWSNPVNVVKPADGEIKLSTLNRSSTKIKIVIDEIEI